MSANQPPRDPLDPPEPSAPDAMPTEPSSGLATPARPPDATGDRHEQAGQSAPALAGTRLSAIWKVLAAALILLTLLLVFILLNLQRVEVNLYGAHTHLPLAVALLLSAVFGAVLVFVIGTARILQVRARARRAGNTGKES